MDTDETTVINHYSLPKPISEILFKLKLSTLARSRRFLQQHQVLLNKKRILDPSTPVISNKDILFIDSKQIDIPSDIYILINKPSGCVCSRKNDSGMPTIFEIAGIDAPGLHTAGRLDADTTGLLILTTDGEFSASLVKPEKHINKTYKITLETPADQKTMKEYTEKCQTGFFVPHEGSEKGFDAQPSELRWVNSGVCLLTISEGKFHQVKRMIAQLGNKVLKLKRIAIGNLNLDENLEEGKFIYMNQNHFEKLSNPGSV